MATENKNKLKVGIILSNKEFPLWISSIIDSINESDVASLVVILFQEANSQVNGSDNSWSYVLYSLYCRLEEYRWSGKKEDCLGIDQNYSLPVDTHKIDIDLIDPDENDLAEIKTFDLDVLLDLSDQTISNNFITATKAGVWSFQHLNGEMNYQTSPIGFWEVYDSCPTMGSKLIATFPATEENRILHRSLYATDDRCSARMNLNKAYRSCNTVVLRKLKHLYDYGVDKFLVDHNKSLDTDNLMTDQSRQYPPGNLKMLNFFTSRIFNSLKMRLMNGLFTEQWAMRYRLADGISLDFNQFEKLTPSLGGLWADPFITYHEGTYYLFFEDAIYDKENADISVMTIDKNGNMGEPKPCLVRPYHLSYPFVFFWEGDYYMIPETKSNQAIELYKAVRFPDQWEFHRNLMENVEAVDTTLFFHNNKWWLFASFKQQKWVSINNELSIFYADSPFSSHWTPHPLNPVITDVRSARPAGRIFEQDGKIIRPSQDSSVRYGYGLRLNEIVTLTETSYEEQEIDFIEPKWEKFLRGTHTLAHAKDLTVVDVLEWRFRFR